MADRDDRDREDDGTTTRRAVVVGGVVTGLAALAARPAHAGAPGRPSPPAPAPVGLQDPVGKYPKPPFKAQKQPWPGLASRMQPRPDHGETSYRGSGRLGGRRALITGGDSGIGRAAAIAYAREGADVAINYLPAEEPDAREVVRLIREEGRKVVTLPGDLRSESFCKRLVADAARRLGGLDILVNNAAKQQSQKSIEDITTAQLDWTFTTNVFAPFWLARAAVPHLKRGACIINTISVTAYDPPEELLDYSMTKGAMLIFTKGLAKQLARRGIRVNGVAPGPFWTPLQVSGGQTQDNLVKFGADTPFGRPGQPAEIASVYVELASPAASFTTGQIYGASGGRGNP